MRSARVGGVKNVFWIAAVAVVAWFLFGERLGDFTAPAPAAAVRQGPGLRQHDFLPLFERDKSLATLARPGQYTVIEVYLDSCAICRRLESGFQSFLQQRRDVVIQRVHFPESGVNLSFTGTQPGQMEREARALQARIEAYKICGTPHVEIYAPDSELIAGDACGAKDGLQFLRHWIAVETGLPARML